LALIAGVPGLLPETAPEDFPSGSKGSALSNWVQIPSVSAAVPSDEKENGALLDEWPDLFADEKASLVDSKSRSRVASADLSSSDLKDKPSSPTAAEEPKKVSQEVPAKGSNSAPTPDVAPAQPAPQPVIAKEEAPAEPAKETTPVAETADSKSRRGVTIKAVDGKLVVFDQDGKPVLTKDPTKDPKVTLVGKDRTIEIPAETPALKEVEVEKTSPETTSEQSSVAPQVEVVATDPAPASELPATDFNEEEEETSAEFVELEGTPTFYEIQKGENLSIIAARFPGVTAAQLMEVNQISDPHSIQIGEKIWIPTTFEGVRHKVQPGETLSELVKLYEIDNLFEICDLNGLSRTQNKLEEGIILVLPGAKPRPVQNRESLHAITQDLSDLSGKVTWAWPVQEKKIPVSSPYGLRVDPFSGKKGSAGGGQDTRWRKTMHHGIDLAAPIGTPVYAARDGEVVEAKRRGNHGLSIKIRHEDGWYTVYSHNSKLLVEKGDKIRQGDKIALSGNTGRSTGPHIHFEIRRPDQKSVNPRALLGPR
jgi:murein DD-endopeptidase MepM/ murein hydrolase activator NlpD